jgi:hypothetical protein
MPPPHCCHADGFCSRRASRADSSAASRCGPSSPTGSGGVGGAEAEDWAGDATSAARVPGAPPPVTGPRLEGVRSPPADPVVRWHTIPSQPLPADGTTSAAGSPGGAPLLRSAPTSSSSGGSGGSSGGGSRGSGSFGSGAGSSPGGFHQAVSKVRAGTGLALPPSTDGFRADVEVRGWEDLR